MPLCGETKRNDTRAIQVTLLLSLGRVVVNWRNIVILLVDANFGEGILEQDRDALKFGYAGEPGEVGERDTADARPDPSLNSALYHRLVGGTS